MDLRKFPNIQVALSAAYVLGTLRGRARLRFAQMLREDAVLYQQVARFEDSLLGGLLTEEQRPAPAWLWPAIAAELPRATTTSPILAPGKAPWWRRPGLWQGLSAVLAAVIAVVLLWPTPAPMPYLAVLNDTTGQATWVLQASHHHMRLVTLHTIQIPAHKSLQLWAIVPGRKPISMGLLPDTAGKTPILPVPDHLNLASASLLAVTLEPAGGSPTGQPTGPILLKAHLVGS